MGMGHGSGQTLAAWGVGPGLGKSKTGGREGWEKDSRKEAGRLEKQRQRNKWEKEKGKTVRNLFEVKRNFTRVLFILMPKLVELGKGFSAALKLTFKKYAENKFKYDCKQLRGETRAYDPVPRGPFSVLQ